MRFCGYRGTYSHAVTVHALPDIFDSFDYLAQIERALISTAQDWEEQDKNLRLDEPALWYVSRPTNRMKPTRLAVRDRELVDTDKSRQVLSLRQFVQPAAFARNAQKLLAWMEERELNRDFLDQWLLAECGAEDVRDLFGSDDHGRPGRCRPRGGGRVDEPRLEDLGLANLPFAIFVRGLGLLRAAAAHRIPRIKELPCHAGHSRASGRGRDLGSRFGPLGEACNSSSGSIQQGSPSHT